MLLTASAWAQAPVVEVTIPDSADVDIELTPTITVAANMDIDSLGITWARWSSDSTKTLNASDTLTPTIWVLPKDVYDSHPDSLWSVLEMGGEYALTADSILTFEPYGLAYATEYVILVHGLPLLDGTGASVAFTDTLVVPFTTIHPVHRFMSASFLPGDPVSCEDTLTIYFNREITSTTTASGPILELERIEGVTLGTGADSTTIVGDSATTLLSNTSLGSDGRSINIVAQDPLPGGYAYRIKVNMQYWTGDPDDDRTAEFGVYGEKKITIGTESTDTNSSYIPSMHVNPQVGVSYYGSGDTARVIAPADHQGWAFVEWVCPENSAIDGSTNPAITIPVECSNLAPLTLTARYDPPEQCPTIEMTTDSGGVPLYYVGNGIDIVPDSLGFVTGQILCESERAMLVAQPDSGYVFVEWESSDTTYDGSTSQVLLISPLLSGPLVTFKPIFVSGLSQCGICDGQAKVIVDDPGPGLVASDIVTLSPDFNGGLLDEHRIASTCPGTVSFTATIKAQHADCYEIYQVNAQEEKGGSTGTAVMVPAVVTGTATSKSTTMSADCRAEVTFYVKRKMYTLRVEQAQYPDNPTVPLSDEDNALVEMRVTSSENGAIVRAVPGETAGGVRYIDYTVKACASVTITAVSHNSDIVFEQYSCESDVECDSPPTNPVMTRTMDHDIKVRGLFMKKFRLEKMEYRREGNMTWEEFAPGEFAAGLTLEEENEHYVSSIRFTFSDEVKLSTVPGNISVLEWGIRIDRLASQAYTPASSTSAVWSNNNTVLEMKLANSGNDIKIHYMQLSLIDVGAGLTSTLDEPLENPRRWFVETRMPGLKAELKQFKTICIGEANPGNAHVIAGGYHSVLKTNPANALSGITPIGGNRQVLVYDGGTIDLIGGEDSDGSIMVPITLVDVNRLTRVDEIMVGAIAIELDGNASSNNLTPQTTIKNSIATRMANRTFDDDIGRELEEIAYPLTKDFWDDDEIIGYASSLMFNRWHYFGLVFSSPYLNDYYVPRSVNPEGETNFHFIINYVQD